MGLREIVKRIYHTFFAIWSLIGVMLCIFAFIFNWRVVFVEFIFALFFVAFLSSLTYIVFYSKNELTVRQLVIRLIMQFLLIMGIVLTVGYFDEWVGIGYPLQTAAIIMSVLIIFTAVTAFEMYQTWRLADKLNLKLQERSGE